MPEPRKKQLKRARDRIESARGFRKSESYDDLWKRMNDLYRGRHFPTNLTYEDKVAVNLCFSTINVIGPSVAVNYPKITVTPVNPEDSDGAEIVEAVVNCWWRKHGVLPEFQNAVKDFLIYGFGYLKTGYRFVEEDEAIPDDEYEEAFESKRVELDEYAAGAPEMAGDLPTDEEVAASIPSTRKVITHDAPFVERVSPHDLFVDPEATSFRDAKWIAQKIVKTYWELWGEDDYKKSAVRRAKPDSRSDEFTFAPDQSWRNHDKKDWQRYTVWEYYDLQDGTMCVFADEGGDEYLVDPVRQPYAFGHPFIMLRNYDVPEQFYPMGELEALEPLQHELNLTRTAMFNDRKQFRRGYLYNPSRFDQAGLSQLASDKDNRAIPVQGNGPLQDAIIPLPAQQPNPELYPQSEIIETDITGISGINEYMRGALPEIRRTATEAAIIQDTANARAADKLARVEKAIGEIGRRMIQLAQQYLHEAQVAHIVGINSLPYHFEFEPEDIKGEYLFEVEGGSTMPMNETQRRQTAMELLQTIAPFGDPQLGLVNMREVIAYALKDGFGIKDPGRFLAPDPAQAQQLGMTEDDEPPMDPMAAEQGAPPDEAMMAAMANEGGGGAPPPPSGAPPGGYGPMAAAEGGGEIPPELLAQLAAQVGAPV